MANVRSSIILSNRMHLSSCPFNGCHPVEGSYYWFHAEQLCLLKGLKTGLVLIYFFTKEHLIILAVIMGK